MNNSHVHVMQIIVKVVVYILILHLPVGHHDKRRHTNIITLKESIVFSAMIWEKYVNISAIDQNEYENIRIFDIGNPISCIPS